MSPRPLPSAEQELRLVRDWARQAAAELPHNHPAQAKLEEISSRPPFPVAQPPAEAHAEVNRTFWHFLFFVLGVTCIAGAATSVPHTPIIAGCLCFAGCVLVGRSKFLA